MSCVHSGKNSSPAVSQSLSSTMQAATMWGILWSLTSILFRRHRQRPATIITEVSNLETNLFKWHDQTETFQPAKRVLNHHPCSTLSVVECLLQKLSGFQCLEMASLARGEKGKRDLQQSPKASSVSMFCVHVCHTVGQEIFEGLNFRGLQNLSLQGK